MTGSYDLVGTGGSGGILGSGGNIVLTNLAGPGLAPLGNYGGPTQTMALLPGSPAIGAGSGAESTPRRDHRPARRAARHAQPRHRRLPEPGIHPHPGRRQHPAVHRDRRGLRQSAGRHRHRQSTRVEPVAGGVVTFTANPACNGASASLSEHDGDDRADGVAQVTATANSTPGSYTVTAAVAGGRRRSLRLTNLTPLTFWA